MVGRNGCIKEYKKLAEKFIEKNNNFTKSMEQVRKTLKHKLMPREQEIIASIRLQILLSKKSRNINPSNSVLPLIEKLEHTLRLKERYLRFVMYKFDVFKKETNKIREGYVKVHLEKMQEILPLKGKYIARLSEINGILEGMLIKAQTVNEGQLEYVKECKEEAIKNKFPLKFIKKFYKLKKKEISEKDVEKRIFEVQRAQKEMGSVRMRIMDFFHAYGRELMWSGRGIAVIMIIIYGNASLQMGEGMILSCALIYLLEDMKKIKYFF